MDAVLEAYLEKGRARAEQLRLLEQEKIEAQAEEDLQAWEQLAEETRKLVPSELKFLVTIPFNIKGLPRVSPDEPGRVERIPVRVDGITGIMCIRVSYARGDGYFLYSDLRRGEGCIEVNTFFSFGDDGELEFDCPEFFTSMEGDIAFARAFGVAQEAHAAREKVVQEQEERNKQRIEAMIKPSWSDVMLKKAQDAVVLSGDPVVIVLSIIAESLVKIASNLDRKG